MTNYLLVLCIILLSKSLYYESYGGGILNLFFLPIALVIIILSKKKFSINKNFILYFCFFVVLLLINSDTRIDSFLNTLIQFFIGILIIQRINFELFSEIFTKIILFIGVFSLLTPLIIYFNIHSPLPDFTAIDGRILRNFLFFGVSENFINQEIYRNAGLWWEPGAFQLFVNLSFIFCLIMNKMSMKRYILFSLIIVSTFSTTGLIVFLLLSIIYFKNEISHSRYKMIASTTILIFFVALSLILIPVIVDKFNADSSSFVSFLSRYTDVEISTKLFVDNFLLGYGFGNADYFQAFAINEYGNALMLSPAKPTGADSLSMFLAQIGIFGFLLLIPFLFPKYYKSMSLLDKIIISISLLFLFNTENFLFLLIFPVLLIYGIISSKNHLNGKYVGSHKRYSR